MFCFNAYTHSLQLFSLRIFAIPELINFRVQQVLQVIFSRCPGFWCTSLSHSDHTSDCNASSDKVVGLFVHIHELFLPQKSCMKTHKVPPKQKRNIHWVKQTSFTREDRCACNLMATNGMTTLRLQQSTLAQHQSNPTLNSPFICENFLLHYLS